MKTLVRLIAVAGLATALGGVLCAAQVEGILVDQHCAAKMTATNNQKAASAHTTACNMMPDCAKAGFGVLTPDGKYITFDEAGNAKAEAALKATKKQSDLKVQVTGEQSGATMKVASITIL